MKDLFVESEWLGLCNRVLSCANKLGVGSHSELLMLQQAKEFVDQEAPQRYKDLLACTAAAARLAVAWQELRQQSAHEEEMIDEAVDESFPASDPPSFSHSHA